MYLFVSLLELIQINLSIAGNQKATIFTNSNQIDACCRLNEMQKAPKGAFGISFSLHKCHKQPPAIISIHAY